MNSNFGETDFDESAKKLLAKNGEGNLIYNAIRLTIPEFTKQRKNLTKNAENKIEWPVAPANKGYSLLEYTEYENGGGNSKLEDRQFTVDLNKFTTDHKHLALYEDEKDMDSRDDAFMARQRARDQVQDEMDNGNKKRGFGDLANVLKAWSERVRAKTGKVEVSKTPNVAGSWERWDVYTKHKQLGKAPFTDGGFAFRIWTFLCVLLILFIVTMVVGVREYEDPNPAPVVRTTINLNIQQNFLDMSPKSADGNYITASGAVGSQGTFSIFLCFVSILFVLLLL
eukprot:481091_1